MRLENGYETCTTFWEDFTIADAFGIPAIKDTFNRAFSGWKHNYEYVTELSMIMSIKSCTWYGKDNQKSELYANYYHEVDNWCLDNLKGDELTYYIKTTD